MASTLEGISLASIRPLLNTLGDIAMFWYIGCALHGGNAFPICFLASLWALVDGYRYGKLCYKESSRGVKCCLLEGWRAVCIASGDAALEECSRIIG